MKDIGRMPPQNLEAEQSVLGSLLIDKNAITKIADSLMPEEFYKNGHRIIYENMLALYEDNEPIDVLSLTARLEERKLLEAAGGRTYLIDLTNAVPTASPRRSSRATSSSDAPENVPPNRPHAAISEPVFSHTTFR